MCYRCVIAWLCSCVTWQLAQWEQCPETFTSSQFMCYRCMITWQCSCVSWKLAQWERCPEKIRWSQFMCYRWEIAWQCSCVTWKPARCEASPLRGWSCAPKTEKWRFWNPHLVLSPETASLLMDIRVSYRSYTDQTPTPTPICPLSSVNAVHSGVLRM